MIFSFQQGNLVTRFCVFHSDMWLSQQCLITQPSTMDMLEMQIGIKELRQSKGHNHHVRAPEPLQGKHGCVFSLFACMEKKG